MTQKLKSSSSSLLIEALRSVHSDLLYLNVTLKCNDGSLMTCGLLLASVSPVIKTIGQLESSDEIVILMPDYNVNQMYSFLTMLTSNQGPRGGEETALFQELLDVLGKESPTMQVASSKSDSFLDDLDEDLDSKTDGFFDWEDSFPPSSGVDDEEGIDSSKAKLPTKKSSSSKRLNAKKMQTSNEDLEKINAEARKCYDLKSGVYLCSQCGTERKNTRSMQQHLMWHQKYPDEDFHTSHICKACGKICADHSLLRAHVRLVHSPRTFACSEDNCDKSFKSKEGLKQHLLVHSGIKNFVCSECGYAVRTKHHLKLHVLKRHTEMKKSIPCEVCGKLFRHMSNLKCHFYTHKARLEREHRCEACNLTFRAKKSLDSHLALHDPNRPFKCSKCPLRYKNKDALVAHENTHENLQYKCEFCDIAYTRKDNLKRHMKEKHNPP